MTHLKKSLRAIPKAQAGQKWPAGPALAAPGVENSPLQGATGVFIVACQNRFGMDQ